MAPEVAKQVSKECASPSGPIHEAEREYGRIIMQWCLKRAKEIS